MTLNAIAEALLPVHLYQRLAASDVGKRLARGSFWSLINALVMKTATLAQAIFLAHILGIAGFGEWGILLSTSAMVCVFASFGLVTTTTKHVAQWRNSEPERLGRLLGLLQLSALVMGLITCGVLIVAAASLAEHMLAAPQLARPLAIIGCVVLMQVLSGVYEGVLTGMECFRDSAIIRGFSTIIGVVITVVLTLYFGLTGAIFGLLLTNLLLASLFAWRAFALIHKADIRVRLKGCWGEWKAIRDFALPTVLAGLMVMVAMWVAQLVLVRQPGGYEEMGAYQAANQWRVMVIFLPTQLLAAYFPVMSSLITTDPMYLRHLQKQMLTSMMLLALGLALPVVFLAPWLMQLYGVVFADFWPVLALLALIPVFDIGHVVLQNAAIAQSYAWTLIWSNLVMVATIAIGVVWLIPEYLGLGLAMTLLLGYATRVLAEYLIYRSRNLT